MSAPVQKEKVIFSKALEIADPAQRRHFLEEACGADSALRDPATPTREK